MHAAELMPAAVLSMQGHRLVWVYDYATVRSTAVIACKACMEVLSLLA